MNQPATEITPSEAIVVSEPMLDSLRATKPWVRLIAVIGFVWVVLMILGGLGNVFGPSHMRHGVAVAIGLVYLAMGIVYFFPCLFLFLYAGAIGRALNGGGGGALEAAFRRQRSFWRYAGVLALIGLVLLVIAFVAGIIVGIAGTGLGHLINA